MRRVLPEISNHLRPRVIRALERRRNGHDGMRVDDDHAVLLEVRQHAHGLRRLEGQQEVCRAAPYHRAPDALADPYVAEDIAAFLGHADRLRTHDGQPFLHRGRRDELRGEHRALSADARQDDILLHHFALPSRFSNDVTSIASNGQMSAQMPQPVHCEASTMILPSSTTMPGQPISRMHFLHLRQAS